MAIILNLYRDLHRMSTNHADGKANNAEPDQTAHLGSLKLIRMYSGCDAQAYPKSLCTQIINNIIKIGYPYSRIFSLLHLVTFKKSRKHSPKLAPIIKLKGGCVGFVLR